MFQQEYDMSLSYYYFENILLLIIILWLVKWLFST